MADLDRTIRWAARRIVIDRVVLGAGRGVVAGAMAGLVILGVDRLAGVAMPVAVYPALLAAAAIAGAAFMLRQPQRLAVAVRLDRHQRLADRLGTAAAMGRAWTSPLAPLVERDAERAAARVDVRAATPIRVTGVWGSATGLAIVLAAGVALLPARAVSSPDEAVARADLQQRRDDVVQTLDEAISVAADTPEPQDLEALERLADQLSGEAPSPAQLAEARDRSAARIDEMAGRLAEQAQRNLDAIDEVTRRATSFNRPADTTVTPGPASDFLDALARGDLEEAAERFETLRDSARNLPSRQREALADELRRLADHLGDRPDETAAGDTPASEGDGNPPDDQAVREALRDALRDLGVDDRTADELLDPSSDADVDEALEREPLDPQTRRALAEDLNRLRDRQTADRDAQREADRLGDALRDAADELAGQPPDDRPPADEPPARHDANEPSPAEGQGPRQRPDRPAEGDQPSQPGQSPDPDGQPQPRQSPDPQGQPQPGQSPDPQGQPQPGQSPDPQGQPQPGRSPDPQGQPQPGRSPDGQGEPQPGQSPDPQGRRQPGQSADGRGDDAGTGGDGRPSRRVEDLLRELDQTRRDAIERQADSEALRDAARRLADTLTEQEKRQLIEQWRPQRDEPAAGATPPPEGEPAPFTQFDDVDLREPDAGDMVISQWLDDSAPGAQPATTRGRTVVRRAQGAAEQAIERSAVPSRYHQLIRRYFDHLPEAVGGSGESEGSGGSGGSDGHDGAGR